MRFIVLLLLSTLFAPAAQPATVTPLLILMQGDYWAWQPETGTLEQRTTWGYHERPVLSPDGTRIAFRSLAAISVAQAKSANTVFTSDRPSNNWVMDRATGPAVEIAGQLADATFDNPNGFDAAIIRSHPAWTTDSAALIWTELEATGSAMRAVRYDFATASTDVIMTGLSIGFQDAGLNLPNVDVGADGIRQQIPFTYIDDALPTGGGSILRQYDLNGNLIDETVAGPISLNRPAAASAASPQPRTQHSSFELYSLHNPAGSGTITYTTVIDEQGRGRTTWYFRAPSGQTYELGDNLTRREMALSPDGHLLAVIRDDGVHVWQGEQETIIPGTELISAPHPHLTPDRVSGLAWGRMGSRDRTDITLTPTPPTPEVTPDASACVIPPDLFEIGMVGQVRPDVALPLNLFGSLPLNNRAGLVQPGTTFTVIGGPDCSWEGYPAWQIEADGQTGWIVQQDSSTSRPWVEPLP